MQSIDVFVIGGGPAGSAAALKLARAGRAVALAERSHYEQSRIGETLPPVAQLTLASLGLWERFERQGHAPSYSIRSAWGRPQLYEQDFGFHPYGSGWHVDRRSFDAMLAEAAADEGATICRGSRVTEITREADVEWRIRLEDQDGHRQFRASFIVDATGRVASFARRRGAIRRAHDALIGVVVFLAPVSSRVKPEFYTLVEAIETGWWYSALLPDERLVAVYMTDADLLPRGRRQFPAFWQTQLERADHTLARLRSFKPASAPRVVVANSSRLDSVTGGGWLAVGDAAMAFDPLSAQGVLQALESGARAGQALNRCLAGDAHALGRYAADTQASFSEYSRLYENYYGREQRWPHSIFWRRRSASRGQERGKDRRQNAKEYSIHGRHLG